MTVLYIYIDTAPNNVDVYIYSAIVLLLLYPHWMKNLQTERRVTHMAAAAAAAADAAAADAVPHSDAVDFVYINPRAPLKSFSH